MLRFLHATLPGFALIAAMLLVAGAVAAAPAAAPAQGGPNLLKNSGFEQGAEAWRLPAGFEVVPGAGRNGTACLHTARTDAKRYDLAGQPIAFKPGRRYRIAAWVRTRDVKGDENGATLCLQWGGAKGFIGGVFPHGPKGTSDWTRVESLTPPIPAEATSVGLSLYLRKGMTGEAWFDDIEASEYWSQPMEAYLAEPAYRGLIFADEPRRAVRLRVELGDLFEGRPWRADGGYEGLDGLAVIGRLVAGGKVVAEKRVADPKSRALEIELDAAGLVVGEYAAEAVLVQGGRDVTTVRLPGEVRPAGPRPRVFIDRHRRTIVDGKPFLPLGVYMGAIKESDMALLDAAGFNCVMPYGLSRTPLDTAAEWLEMARRHHVMVIYSVKDIYPGIKSFPAKGVDGRLGATEIVTAAVERFRSHPAVLAWYLNDELPTSMRPALEDRYRLVRRLDPDHPTWAVLYQVDELRDYRHTCDVLGTDPYPIPKKPAAQAAEWAAKTVAATGGAAAVWQVPQMFDWGIYRPDEAAMTRAPTYEEMRTMTYLAIIEGARGLVYYSFSNLAKDRLGFDARWKDVSRVAGEMRDLAPAILAVDPPPAGLAVTGPRWMATCEGRRAWVFVTNPDAQPVAMRLTVPAGASVRTHGGRAVTVRDGAAQEDLPPLGCEAYVISPP